MVEHSHTECAGRLRNVIGNDFNGCHADLFCDGSGVLARGG